MILGVDRFGGMLALHYSPTRPSGTPSPNQKDLGIAEHPGAQRREGWGRAFSFARFPVKCYTMMLSMSF